MTTTTGAPQALTRAEVDDAPVGTLVCTSKTTRSEVAIKIAPASRSSMGLWRTTTGMQFDFAIAQAGAVLLVPANLTLSKDPATTLDNVATNAELVAEDAAPRG